jgi:hypothetical protein
MYYLFVLSHCCLLVVFCVNYPFPWMTNWWNLVILENKAGIFVNNPRIQVSLYILRFSKLKCQQAGKNQSYLLKRRIYSDTWIRGLLTNIPALFSKITKFHQLVIQGKG